MGELLRNDIEIFLYEKGMIHAKVMIIDDTILRVGSSNLSNRSMGFD
jgi:phosphatidylserine/phosphatidylglycerophosphate/cardiolipin synthase-like enzyme